MQRVEKFSEKEKKPNNQKNKKNNTKNVEHINQCDPLSVSLTTSKDTAPCTCPSGKIMQKNMETPIVLMGITMPVNYWCQ